MDQLSLIPEIEITEQKIKALDELFIGASLYNQSENYLKLLEFINRFPKLSPFNAFLVYNQNPGVKVVMTPRKWKAYGRRIKPYARPLVILIPFGPVSFVYDIADTEGAPVPEELTNPFKTTGDLPREYYENMVVNSRAQFIEVVYNNLTSDTAGYVRRFSNKYQITLNEKWNLLVKYSTLIHELGHIFCGHQKPFNNSIWKDRSYLNREIREIEAESVSFLVCKRIGLETTAEQYLSSYVKNNETIPQISLDTVLTVSGYIERMNFSDFKLRKK